MLTAKLNLRPRRNAGDAEINRRISDREFISVDSGSDLASGNRAGHQLHPHPSRRQSDPRRSCTRYRSVPFSLLFCFYRGDWVESDAIRQATEDEEGTLPARRGHVDHKRDSGKGRVERSESVCEELQGGVWRYAI